MEAPRNGSAGALDSVADRSTGILLAWPTYGFSSLLERMLLSQAWIYAQCPPQPSASVHFCEASHPPALSVRVVLIGHICQKCCDYALLMLPFELKKRVDTDINTCKSRFTRIRLQHTLSRCAIPYQTTHKRWIAGRTWTGLTVRRPLCGIA